MDVKGTRSACRTAAKVQGAIIAVLILLSLSGLVWQTLLQHETLSRLVRWFNLDDELNFPTAYQIAALGTAAALLFSIGRHRTQSFRWHWLALSAIFLVLACDEGLRIHEHLKLAWAVRVNHELKQVSPLFAHRWILYAIPLVVVVGLTYLPFLLRLPRRVCISMMAAGAIFVGGSVGMEMVGSEWVASHGKDFGYGLLANVEESMEMIGIAIFNCTLLYYRQHYLMPSNPASESAWAILAPGRSRLSIGR